MSLKTVIRTKDFTACKKFYTQVLQLEIVEEYDDGDGSKGVILRFGDKNSNAFLEISEIKHQNSYHQKAFDNNFENDKAGIQIETTDISYWSNHLQEFWEARGPIQRPWGSKYLYLRDPDGLQIIIYQEN
ncbi:MAG: VOC family protein [Flavobacteriaceae bacterium]|nr:VOC family protein [Flavobacteriaceae bacterium]